MLLEYALEMRTVLLVRRMFHGWERVTKEERIVMWENERKARKQHEQYVICDDNHQRGEPEQAKTTSYK